MPAPTAGIWIHWRAMTAPHSAVPDLAPPTPVRSPGARLRLELIILGISIVCGLVLMPFLIWLVGNRLLGPYTHGQDASAGTGPLRLLADYFSGLGHGSVMFWCVAVGPYLIVLFIRLLYRLLRSPRPPAAPAPRDRRADLGRGRIEPHL